MGPKFCPGDEEVNISVVESVYDISVVESIHDVSAVESIYDFHGSIGSSRDT
jgi:hypothetical protein